MGHWKLLIHLEGDTDLLAIHAMIFSKLNPGTYGVAGDP